MYQVVLCTCPNEKVAKEIALHLVKQQHAACVNILPNVTSVYRWDNSVEIDNETQLFIKTASVKFDVVCQEITKIHPYDVPEIIALNIQQGDKQYLNWINESLS